MAKNASAASRDGLLLPIKIAPDLHQRFKIAAAEEGLTYAELIEGLLNLRDARLAKAVRGQRHPLDRRQALLNFVTPREGK